jgi:tetratricopeptide (TPR) repeat protein
MPIRPVLLAAACLLVGLPAGASFTAEAVDRGKLSLAWDAHESGGCEEVLGYVQEIPPGSAVEAEALWLKADCLSLLGRHAEAVAVLEGPGGPSVQDRDRLLEDFYYDWALDRSGREDYDRALEVLDRALAARPGALSLAALREATRFRRDLHRTLPGGRVAAGPLRLTGGEVVVVRRGAERSPGPGWILVYPWNGKASWVPESTLGEWMPSLASRLDRTGRSLWLRVSGEGVRRAFEVEAKAAGLTVRREEGGWTLGLGEEEVFVDAPEWAFRAAAEGLGGRGAALAAVAQAKVSLESRRTLAHWIVENRGSLEVTRDGPTVRVRDPRTGRNHALDLAAWGESYDPASKEWRSFWSDLSTELARPAGAYRCFCGREAVVRETLVSEADAVEAGALVVEKGRGYAVVLTALCPLHQQYVTRELLDAWGVSLRSASDRARGDALAKPWGLTFERGEENGTAYLALEGEGVSSLARRPDLLLGALEAVEGREVRGASVSVVAPTASSLVVLRSRVSREREQAAALRALLRGTRRRGGEGRLGYRTDLRLPQAASGVFEVRPAE